MIIKNNNSNLIEFKSTPWNDQIISQETNEIYRFIADDQNKSDNLINEFEDYFVVDSMPLEVCKLSRSSRSKICKEDTYAFPDKGYCAAQSSSYYGYKLHAVCSVNGVFQSIVLT